MTIPCRECLKFAICIGQKQLSCEDVYTYFNDSHDRLKLEVSGTLEPNQITLEDRNKAWDMLWDVMREDLPNLQGLFRSSKRQKFPNDSNPLYKRPGQL